MEITKLAIIETVLAVAIYAYLGIHMGTFKYLALAVVFAPLMLFRTKESAEWGILVYGKWHKKTDAIVDKTINSKFLLDSRLGDITFYLGIVLSTIAMVLGGIIIRITATVYWGVRRPLSTLKEAPGNWLRQSLCTDFFHPPEIVPLEALRWNNESERITFISTIKDIIGMNGFGEKLVWSMVASPVVIIGYLPPLIYRVTFKATSIAYLPFIWVIRETLSSTVSVKERLKRFKDSEIEKTRQKISWFIIFTLIGKFLYVYGWLERSRFEDKFPSTRFIDDVVNPYGLPWWQFTLGVDAALTIILIYFPGLALYRIEQKKIWSENFALNTVSTISLLRATLSIVTISFFFYVALKNAAPGLASRIFGA